MKKRICTWLLMVPAVWEQVLQERVKESHSEAGFFIINAGISLLPPTKGEISPVKSEAIALDRVCISCQHWLYYAENEHLISDFSGILDMLNKNLCDIPNRRLQCIMEPVQNYNFLQTIYLDNQIRSLIRLADYVGMSVGTLSTIPVAHQDC